MLSRILISCWLLLSLLPVAAQTQAPPLAESEASASPAEGLLWKITKDSLPPSYLFGTIHSSDPRVLDLPPPVRQALESSNCLILEARLSDIDKSVLLEKLYLPNEQNLAVLLGKEAFQRLFLALSEHGVLITMAMRLKPWVAMTILSFPNNESGDYLDLSLEKRAQARGMPVYGLESLDEQLSVFEKFSLDEQLIMLQATLAELDKMPAYLAQMHQLYLARDLGGIQQLSASLMHSENPQEEALTQTLWKRLLEDRNHLMQERMQQHLLAGNAFIAIGALHLADSQGLIRLLRRQGYQLTKVY